MGLYSRLRFNCRTFTPHEKTPDGDTALKHYLPSCLENIQPVYLHIYTRTHVSTHARSHARTHARKHARTHARKHEPIHNYITDIIVFQFVSLMRDLLLNPKTSVKLVRNLAVDFVLFRQHRRMLIGLYSSNLKMAVGPEDTKQHYLRSSVGWT